MLFRSMLGKMVNSINAMNSNTQKSSEQMENLVSDIKALNKEMEGFNKNMEQNSKNLVEATKEFNDVVDKFEKPLNSFTNSMDDFISSYNGMDYKIKELSELVNDSFKGIVDKFIKYFDENTTQQMSFIEKNNYVQEITIQSMKDATYAINNNMTELQATYIKLSGIINNMEDNTKMQNNEFRKMILELENVLSELNKQVNSMSDRIAVKNAETLSNSASEISNCLYGVTDKMERQLEQISKEFNDTQEKQQQKNRETLEIMKNTIESIYKNVEELQTINLVK